MSADCFNTVQHKDADGVETFEPGDMESRVLCGESTARFSRHADGFRPETAGPRTRYSGCRFQWAKTFQDL